MKKIILILMLLSAALLAGCAEGASNTANAPTRPSTPVATPTTATTGNNYSNSQVSNTSATSSNSTMSNARIEYNKNRASNTKTTNSNISSAPAPPTEKKEEGLFSFPPPRPTSVAEIPKAELPLADGSRTLAETSDKIVAGLKAAGYQNGKYTFFWNDSNEFAVVTAMERVQPSGEVALVGRWDDSDMLPSATGEYFNDLIRGRKVFYRVFAFIFTPKNKKWQTYLRGTPPDFNTARHWIENPSGGDTVGEGGTSDIATARFTADYKCFELLYLFVNHTSLDAPTAIDPRDDKDERRVKGIITELNKDAAEHRRKTNIRFGEER